MNAFFKFLRRWWVHRFGGEPHYELESVESDPPEAFSPHILYVVTEDGEPWHVAMLCPCGCHAAIELNLIPDERPCWRLTRHWRGLPSIHPSIWRKRGCRAHFWIRRGRVLWSGNHHRASCG